MSCKNERPETIERDQATGSARRGIGCDCPCGSCPQKAKWICLAGLAAALGLIAVRTLRRSTAAAS